MKTWVVYINDLEGCRIVGVYSSKEKAEAERLNQFMQTGINYMVEISEQALQ